MSGLRPSALPKLAQCPSYESKPGASAAASRGTAMDALYRSMLGGFPVEEEHAESVKALTEDDVASVQWAVNRTRIIVKDGDFVADENRLRAYVPGVGWGTMDGLAANVSTLTDLKTGQIRSYLEQMAGYSLGMMDAYFRDEWRAVLLFCDAREVVEHVFTRAEAERIVREVLASYHDENREANPCDYCGWCAKALTCDARLTLAEDVLSLVNVRQGVDRLLNSRESLAHFLKGAKVVADLESHAKAHAKELLKTDEKSVPGFRRIEVRGSEYVSPEVLNQALEEWADPVELLDLCQPPTPSKLRDYAEKKGVNLPEDHFPRSEGNCQLRAMTYAAAKKAAKKTAKKAAKKKASKA